MGSVTGIQWCDKTFSPWWGCTKVSPGCANCYAENMNLRFGGQHYKSGIPRAIASNAVWSEPFKWNRSAARIGVRPRVFCASMCDLLDQETPFLWRGLAWEVIKACDALDWLVLTKRHGSLDEVPTRPDGSAFDHVWLGVSVENRRAVRDRVPALLNTPAALRFLSVEPLIESVASELHEYIRYLDWIILGGESGPGARFCSASWFAPIIEECARHRVPVFVKQMGSAWAQEHRAHGVTSKKGDDPAEWPDSIRVRQWPTSRAA